MFAAAGRLSRRTRRGARGGLGAIGAGLLLVGVAPAAVTATGVTVPEPEPEPLPPAVLAQHVVALPGGDYTWLVDTDGLEGTSPGGVPLTFVVVTGGSFTITDEAGVALYLLAAGEVAVMTSPFGAVPADGDDAAGLVAISLVPDGDTPFPVGEGLYDAEFLRVDLDPAEIADLADPGSIPMVLFAPEGGLIVTGEAASAEGHPDGIELNLGAHRPFEGSLTVINAGIDDVTALAARLTPVAMAAPAGPAATTG